MILNDLDLEALYNQPEKENIELDVPQPEKKEEKTNKDPIKENSDSPDKKEEKEEKPEQQEEEYSVDSKGNLVNSKNEIVYKKGEFDVKEDGSVVVTKESKNEIIDLFKEDVEFVDEEGNPIVFDNTEEGKKQAIDFVVNTKFSQAYANLVQAVPVIDKLVKAVAEGKNYNTVLQEYMAAPKWGDVDFKELSDNQTKDLCYYYLTKIAKLDDETAKVTINLYEDGGKLKTQSEVFLNKIKEYEINEEKVQAQKEKAERQQREQQAKEHNQKIATIINAGNLHSIVIPQKEKQAFADYVLSVEKDGYTKVAKDYSNLTIEQKLAIDYMIYKGVNFKDVIEKSATTIKIKQDLGSGSGVPKAGTMKIKTANNGGIFNANDLDFSQIK